jgi:class 3 adenylate cyclase
MTVADQSDARDATASSADDVAERAAPYVSRLLIQHLATDPDKRTWTGEGTAAFVDISGFTKLSESLAKRGRVGAEQVADSIGHVFESSTGCVSNGNSPSSSVETRCCCGSTATSTLCARARGLLMRALAAIGKIEVPDGTVALRMSQGVHSGQFNFFAVGLGHRELLPVGPAWSRLVAIQHVANPDEIAVTEETGAQLPAECLGEGKSAGRLLVAVPKEHDEDLPLRSRPPLSPQLLAACLSAPIREHVLSGGVSSEHRPVTIAFLRFEGTDALIGERGADAAADALNAVLVAVESACDQHGVAFLASDVDADGGKLIITGGAPKGTGNDEERVLLAVRAIIANPLPIPVRIGVHRGAVFAGDIGPRYRRTYTVMGDAVNLAARVMAKAEPGTIYATADVLERSNTLFETRALEPFAVKGKAEPIQAWAVGNAQGSRTRQVLLQRLPLTGRNTELGMVRKAFTSARSGAGRLIDVVGEAGIGKTRLLEALRDAAAGFRKLHATCEAYTTSKPYALWRELLREQMSIGRDAQDDAVIDQLRSVVATQAPELVAWLPLIAMAFDVEIPPTPEMELLADANRRTRLHESVGRFLEIVIAGPALIEIESAQHIDEASGGLLSYLIGEVASRPWLFAVARRPVAGGFDPPKSESVVRIELKPLAPQDALRLAQLATQQTPLPAHVLDVVAKRSGGNPQFLRDLLRTAIESGGVADLPDSAEAAAMAQIDDLSPEDRSVVRRASVFGIRSTRGCLPGSPTRAKAPRRRRRCGSGCANCSTRSRTVICGSGARCCATPHTRGCRIGCGASCTPSSRRASRRKWITPRNRRAFFRCTTSKRAIIHAHGATAASLHFARKPPTRTSKPHGSIRARSRRVARFPASTRASLRKCRCCSPIHGSRRGSSARRRMFTPPRARW